MQSPVYLTSHAFNLPCISLASPSHRRQVEALHASTRASKEKLAEEKRQAAAQEREKLAAERERKRGHDEWLRNNKQQVKLRLQSPLASRFKLPLHLH